MKVFRILIFLALAGGLFPFDVLAQTSGVSPVAVNKDVADGGAKVGDILSVSGDGSLKRSDVAYDSKMVGVIVDAPVISVEPRSDTTKAVVSAGEAKVNVSSSGGNIAIGDFITTSTTRGVGQKAGASGYVLGKALASYNGSGDGIIPVMIQIGEHQTGLASATGPLGFFQAIVVDKSKLRLVLAGIVALFVLVSAVVAFLRLVNSGVSAIGRNPMARAQIMRSMFLSGFVVLVITVLGFGAAAAIIFLGPK